MKQPTPEQLEMCKRFCGTMGGFHSMLCPLSGVDHPSRPGNTFTPETIEEEAERVFGACGGKCGEAPCIEWNKAHGRIGLSSNPIPGSINNPHPDAPLHNPVYVLKMFLCRFQDVDFGNWKMPDGTPLYDLLPWAQMEEAVRLDEERNAEARTQIGNTPSSEAPPAPQFITIPPPPGCQTPEGHDRVNAAMKAFEESREEVARLATNLFTVDGAQVMMAALRLEGQGDTADGVKDLAIAVMTRKAAEEAFMRAVAGLPEKPKRYPAYINRRFVMVSVPEN